MYFLNNFAKRIGGISYPPIKPKPMGFPLSNISA